MDTVVVTGATGGIGTAVASAFAEAGDRVVLSARDEERLTEIAADIEGETVTVRADVRDEFDLERMAEVAARSGDAGIDIVIPCAAVYHGESGATPLAETSYAAFDDTLRTNTRGVFATILECVPHMAPEGRVIVPTGAVADGAHEGYGAYAVSKAGAEAVMRGFAAELEQAVGAVDPGVVATTLTGDRGRDPSEIADIFRWAAEIDGADLDGSVLGLRAYRSDRDD